jgi:predicted ATPase
MLARRAYVPNELLPSKTSSRRQWPLDVPCVAQLVEEGMTFERPVTFLVGENGSGKSTLVEAFAEAWGLDARGGRAGRKYVNDRPKTPLGEMLKFERAPSGGATSIAQRPRSDS